MTQPASAVPSSPSWIVLKFGGTSVSTRPRWDKIAAIAKAWRAKHRHVLIVVSALSGTTDKLKSICDSHADIAHCKTVAGEIAARHRAMFVELGLTDAHGIEGWLARLEQLIDDPRRGKCALSWQAEVLALGELMSSTLGVTYLNTQAAATRWLDAREHLLSVPMPNQNAWGRYLSASVPTALDAALIAHLPTLGETFITQGFMARNEDGETVILGRGGSDTSASYFGALLGAEKVEIWTDVAGMFRANPRQVPNARLLSRLE